MRLETPELIASTFRNNRRYSDYPDFVLVPRPAYRFQPHAFNFINLWDNTSIILLYSSPSTCHYHIHQSIASLSLSQTSWAESLCPRPRDRPLKKREREREREREKGGGRGRKRDRGGERERVEKGERGRLETFTAFC